MEWSSNVSITIPWREGKLENGTVVWISKASKADRKGFHGLVQMVVCFFSQSHGSHPFSAPRGGGMYLQQTGKRLSVAVVPTETQKQDSCWDCYSCLFPHPQVFRMFLREHLASLQISLGVGSTL